MRLNEDTIRAAFERHEAIYNAKPEWNIGYHVKCWEHAHAAFDHAGSVEEFTWIYDQLYRRWKAFRNAAGSCWRPEQTHAYLMQHAAQWRAMTLVDLRDTHMPAFESLVTGMCGLKPTSSGASIVAISKFLHFMNPRLFVIVDDAVIWRFVLEHQWLWRGVETTRTRLAEVVKRRVPVGNACDVVSYLAVVRWCGELLADNPGIVSAFSEHVRRHNGGMPLPRPVEAAAIEWCLLGLVELPPAGVVLD